MLNMTQALEVAATVYGVGGAAAVLFQARQMLTRRASCDVSARFFAVYTGGYAIWLLYGLSIGSVPLIVADTVGLVCGLVTLAIALRMRGSLWDVGSWNSCPLPGAPAAAAAEPAPLPRPLADRDAGGADAPVAMPVGAAGR